MMVLPKQYEYLASEPGPKMLIEALKLLGTKEITGKKHSPEILEWADELELENLYSNDEIPWCGLFVAIVAKRGEKEVPKNPLWALNWQHFGRPVKDAMLGDVLVFRRKSGGHVGLYVGEDRTAYHVLGGNQGNEVNITRILRNRLHAIRRPTWKIAQPANVRKIFLNTQGHVSTNEA
ncbi:MAG: TIGR02594 family protein [Chitinophagales bacterium]|nr:TIGR02594 family protein [Chitinophagales bacterium]